MFQIIFNEVSAADVSRLDTLLQLELMDEFKVTPEDLENLEDERFGRLDREGKTLLRFRAKDYRIYFEVTDEGILVHRVLHKNTFQDFKYRSNLGKSEDEQLSQSKNFWKLIDEGKNARRA